MSFQGKLNAYKCTDCGAEIVTIDRAEGTTPFQLGCVASASCKGHMVSAMYRIEQTATPAFEWYRATDAEAIAMGGGSLQHHEMGGLFIRRIDGSPLIPDGPAEDANAPRVEAVWCTLCGGRFTFAEIKGKNGCPSCGSRSVPCDVANDLRAIVNWHELHILTIWAENFARISASREGAGPVDFSMRFTVMAIAGRLQRQFPQLGQLTLAGEIAVLPGDLAKAGIEISGIETNIERPAPIPVNGPGAVVPAEGVTMAEAQAELTHLIDAELAKRNSGKEWAIIQELREEEGAAITLICDNPDFHGPSAGVDYCAECTGWHPQRFSGENVLEALTAAKAHRDAFVRPEPEKKS